MKELLLKSFILILAFCVQFSPAFAKSRVNMRADVNTEFSVKTRELPNEISFKITETKTIPDVITIPENSLVTSLA